MPVWQKELKDRLGSRVSWERNERLLYSHDVASLPEVIARMLRNLPDAVVQPVTVEELVYLSGFARKHGMPLVPRGAGTSGYGGAVPARNGLVVEMTRMRRVLEIDPEGKKVTVEPGVIWQDLEQQLAHHGLALRLYPTSAPGSTVGGWVAEGGSGDREL